jgi:serine/threonine protein kinase
MIAMEDRYEILDVVARGAMTTIWRARDVRLDRVVAVKRPHSADASAAFTEAARSAAGVTHPNLITILDAGTDETGPYLVMAFVDGPTLAEMGGAPDGVATLGSEIASGLSALHAAGIVHGDIKPSNILLARTGSKLTSFATARTPGAATGSGVATRRFEAPEVLAGSDPTHAADVYALGSVLSWLAAQTSPDPELSSIIQPAMSEEPTVRPTAATLAEQLSRIASASAPVVTTAPQDATAADNDETRVFETAPAQLEVPEREAEPPPPRRGRRVAAVIGVMLLLLLVAVATLPGDDDDPVAADTTSVATTTADAAPASTTEESSAPDTSEEEESGGVFNTVRIFVTFIRDTPRNVLTNSGAEDIISDVADGVSEAIRGNAEEAQSNLADAVDTVQEEIESDSIIDRAIDLIARIARQLGLDADQVVEPSE